MAPEVRRVWALGGCQAACEVEKWALGSDWGADGYATRHEVDELAGSLGLGPGVRLLDVGGGQGWPGLYLARETGCSVVVTDPYFDGLAAAAARAERESIGDRAWVVPAQAEQLPLKAEYFDSVVHTDVLCCLGPKLPVLRETHRVLRPGGRTAFSVIFPALGLSRSDFQRAVAAGPDDCAVPGGDYRALLADAEFSEIEERDVSDAYLETAKRKLVAADRYAEGMRELFGEEYFEQKQAERRAGIAAISDGLLKRSWFAALRP